MPSERQLAPMLAGIAPNHRARYRYAIGKAHGLQLADIGCGCGYGAWMLSCVMPDAHIVAIDNSEEALEYAREHYSTPQIAYRPLDWWKILVALDTHKFDTLVCFEAIEHVVDDTLLMQEIAGTLALGGELILSTPHGINAPFNPVDYPWHIRHYTPDTLTALIEGAGLEIIERFTQLDCQIGRIAPGWEHGLVLGVIARKV